MFSDLLNFPGSVKEEKNAKVEPVSKSEDLYYGNRYLKRYNPKFRWNNRYSTNNKGSGNQSSHMRKVNPREKDREITKYNFCGPIYHWAKSCPDSHKNK